jgi:hypothetical protein
VKGLSLDFHSWRGLFFWPAEPDLFDFRITLGFVTFWVCRRCVSDTFFKMAKRIRDLEGK